MRILKTLCVLIATVCALSGHAFAQDWHPEFRSDQHIYVAPDAPSVPLASGLADELKQLAGGVDSFEVYVVIAKGEARSAGPLSATIFDYWSKDERFPKERSLIITITGPSGQAPISAGARAGLDLNRLGINRDLMNSQTGPIWAIKPLLNEHPELIPAGVTASIAAIVHSKGGFAAAKQAQVEKKKESGSDGLEFLYICGIGALVAAFFIWLLGFSPWAREKQRLARLREEEKAAEAARVAAEKAKELWEKIQALSLDATPDSSRIKQLLCADLKIEMSSAAELIEEYKRFVFLCVQYKLYASPSEIVDKVWHLHMTEDTEAYYVTMCGGVLKQILFHDPFNGAADEKKGPEMYKRTLDAYREFFGVEPSQTYWPVS